MLRTLSIALCCLSLADFAPAAVISRDWLAPGDGLLTLDQRTGREWLDLSVTQLAPVLDENNQLRPAYLAVLEELRPGGSLEEFSVALASEVVELAESAGIDATSESFSVNSEPARELVSLLTNVALVDLGPNASVAAYTGIMADEHRTQLSTRIGATVFSREVSRLPLGRPATGEAGVATVNLDAPALDLGVFLYRQIIPEPNAARLLLFAMGMHAMHRSRPT